MNLSNFVLAGSVTLAGSIPNTLNGGGATGYLDVTANIGGTGPLRIINSVASAPVGGGVILESVNTFSGDTTMRNYGTNGAYIARLTLKNQYALENSTFAGAYETNSLTAVLQFGGGLTSFTLGGLSGTSLSTNAPNGYGPMPLNIDLKNTSSTAIALSVGNNNQTTTYGGVLSGSNGGSLIKIGTGTLVLTNASTYTGNTTVRPAR